jgi:anti-sigma regulatory factor (Ser/Thr protein kinase)
VTLVMAHEVPASSTMAVPHGPSGVGTARRRMREELRAHGAPDTVVDDAVLILSELLSNSCRHARPLRDDASVRASWSRDTEGGLTISVTDGGGPTRPLPATPSVSARGGRGLAIISALAREWGVEEETGAPSEGVTVWVVLTANSGQTDDGHHTAGAGAGSKPAPPHQRRHGHHGRGRRLNGNGHGAGVAGRSDAHIAEPLAGFDWSAVEELR